MPKVLSLPRLVDLSSPPDAAQHAQDGQFNWRWCRKLGGVIARRTALLRPLRVTILPMVGLTSLASAEEGIAIA